MFRKALPVSAALMLTAASAWTQPPPPPAVPPPLGLPARGVIGAGGVLRELPPGHITVRHENSNYFLADGTFYLASGGAFVATLPPLGMILPSIPGGAVEVEGSHRMMYRCRGVLYRKYGRRWEVASVD
ncbi:MAG: DUF6515 family protein [Pseudomonadota bacterium]